MMERDTPAEIRASDGYLSGLVGDDGDPLDPFARICAGDQRHGEVAVIRLAAGHRHRIVVENLVGDVDAGGDRRADRQQAGMIVGAVADVLEHMLARRERRLADPVGALAAHLRAALGVAARHELHHPVAADAGIAARPIRQHGR